ncbi:hypothetical protein JSQ81_10230 [Sporosarcina sp. Marseille-Q4063]|uniref:hypothetical protein n=1 Tax=Sporosarcina sp. Marseille-Q4063 TaxID=2810514 RepID=UPI001BAE774A|nr:hypothetical protein [Sporosarcina sp. Marseille-Q4063]QUW20259.1 hypothetical protein JSQ81_10230 [Sporosarcina sp. Marseille-Q4063]
MLTFEQKQEIIESFPELTRKEVSMKRVNYHYEDSQFDKTVVVQHLHPNGNAFVYVAGLPGYSADDRGLVNVREATEEELRKTIADSIALLSEEEAEEPTVEETWVNGEGVELKLVEEEGAWNIYHGLNLEESFGNYGYAQGYLKDEQFTKVEE